MGYYKEIMENKKILLTGGSGKLGKAIIKSGLFSNILRPTHSEMNIENLQAVKRYFGSNRFYAVINCAALARMHECELDPKNAIMANIIGTSNLVIATIEKSESEKKKIRFIHISTDGVYNSSRGNYKEDDAAIPYNRYGWSKLGSECAVNMLDDFCIVRTSFFEPEKIRFDCSADDSYNSKLTSDEIVRAIYELLGHSFVGTINVGSERRSDFERYSQFKKGLRKCKFRDIQKSATVPLGRDASLDTSKWKRISKQRTG